MTEKEFKKLRPLDLIQLLLAQGNEASRLQEELDGKNGKIALLKESNDILKAKLNDRDALVDLLKVKLDRSDADIRELEREKEALYSDRWIDLEEWGTLTEAVQELYEIFETAQKEAEQCLQEGGQESGELPESSVIEAPQPIISTVEEPAEESVEESDFGTTVDESNEKLQQEIEIVEEAEEAKEKEPEKEPEEAAIEIKEPEESKKPDQAPNNIEETHSKPESPKSHHKKFFAGLKFGRHK